MLCEPSELLQWPSLDDSAVIMTLWLASVVWLLIAEVWAMSWVLCWEWCGLASGPSSVLIRCCLPFGLRCLSSKDTRSTMHRSFWGESGVAIGEKPYHTLVSLW